MSQAGLFHVLMGAATCPADLALLIVAFNPTLAERSLSSPPGRVLLRGFQP